MAQWTTTSAAAAMVGIIGSAWAGGKAHTLHTDLGEGDAHTNPVVKTGGIAGISAFSVPGLMAASVPSRELAEQWAAIYNRGKVTAPPVAVASLAAYAFLAYELKNGGQLNWERYGLAGALTAGIIPFTLIGMASTNGALMQVAGGATSLSDDATRSLLLRWQGLNLVRSMLPLAGAVLGLWTLVAR